MSVSAALHGLGRYAPWEERFDFTPPAPGPAEEVGAPDFVGIGVQKAGTTWWYTLMLSHPDVSLRPTFTRNDTSLIGSALEPSAPRYLGLSGLVPTEARDSSRGVDARLLQLRLGTAPSPPRRSGRPPVAFAARSGRSVLFRTGPPKRAVFVATEGRSPMLSSEACTTVP